MGILIPLVVIFFTCLFIWRACDGFERASDYIGRNLSEGVRGATLNAISSSLPELFTTLIALFVLADKDGFAVGIGTTAGSALFNGMIIPAACILFVVGTRIAGKMVTAVNVSQKVILRDGLTLIFVQVVLVLILAGSQLVWWQGLVLMLLYFAYIAYMLLSMGDKHNTEGEVDEDAEEEEDDDEGSEPEGPIGKMFYWLSLGPVLDLESHFIKERHLKQIEEEEWNGWPLLLASAAIIGLACYLLVLGCEWLGTGGGNENHLSYHLFGREFTGLGMPTMFVAVIFAAMATSVPDTIISIRDAQKGEYDDAVANALGSNVFDICFALGFPLFLYTALYGGIEMSPETIEQSAELRLALLILTVLGFLVFLVGKRTVAPNGSKLIAMRKGHACALLGIYVAFLVYIIARSLKAPWAKSIADWMVAIVEMVAK